MAQNAFGGLLVVLAAAAWAVAAVGLANLLAQ
jgi:hypothetical protein